jgi:hypothetical protein
MHVSATPPDRTRQAVRFVVQERCSDGENVGELIDDENHCQASARVEIFNEAITSTARETRFGPGDPPGMSASSLVRPGHTY